MSKSNVQFLVAMLLLSGAALQAMEPKETAEGQKLAREFQNGVRAENVETMRIESCLDAVTTALRFVDKKDRSTVKSAWYTLHALAGALEIIIEEQPKSNDPYRVRSREESLLSFVEQFRRSYFPEKIKE